MVGSILKIVLGVAIGVPLFMWFFQERMLFFPRPLASRPAPRPNVEEVSIAAADGVKLWGWLVKGDGTPAPLVIYFGGNAEEVSWLVDLADQFAGWSLLLVNFRGYGESEGKPGEKELLDDGLVIYDYATGRRCSALLRPTTGSSRPRTPAFCSKPGAVRKLGMEFRARTTTASPLSPNTGARLRNF